MNTISVIVTTYNRPHALDKVLESLASQNVSPLEIIVADDGSGPDTSAVLKTWQGRMHCPLHHVWQPDEGFRAGRVRNQAVVKSSGDYLVFIDGDCIVFPDFILRHIKLAEPDRFVAGNRILLGSNLTKAIELGAERPQYWGIIRWIYERLRGRVNRLLPLARFPGQRWRLFKSRHWQGARTCNLAIWRKNFVAVNGFDEAFHGWGHEDAELVVRLMRNGVLRKEGRFAVPVLHLWHKESDRGNEQKNRRRLQDVIEGRRPVRAQVGMDGD